MISTEELNDINELIDPHALLQKIDFHYDRIHEEKNSILAFCPLHGDHIIKTLSLDKQNKSFRCRYTLCSGFQGGSLIELWAVYMGISVDKATYDIVEMFGLPKDLPPSHNMVEKEIALAEEALKKNDLHQAREHLKTVLEYDPENVRAVKLQAMLGLDDNSSTHFMLQLSKMKEIAKEKQQSNEILNILSQLSEDKEPSIKITSKKLEILQSLGDQKAVLSELKALASLYRANNYLDNALKLYKTIIQHEPTNKEIKDSIAQLLPQLENQQTAVDHFFKLYENHMSTNQPEAALQDLEEVLSIQPTYGMAYEELSNLYVTLGNLNKACEIRLDYARILYEQNNIKDALEYAADSLKLDPNNEGIYIFLAKLYLENDLSSAKANQYYLTAGNIFINKKNYKEALKYLEKISPDSRENTSTLKAMIKVYIHLKKEDYAVYYSLRLVDRYVAENKIDKSGGILKNIAGIYPGNSILREKYEEFKNVYCSNP